MHLADQAVPLMQLLKTMPPWATHVLTGIISALFALVGAYLALARDVIYIKGVVDEIARDHEKREANTQEVARLKERFDRFEERSRQVRPKPSHF